MNINFMKELVEKELFKRKGIEVLEIHNEIYNHYKSYIKGNANETLWTCRKKLTIKYIIGETIRIHDNGDVIRKYGNLNIKVSGNEVVGIINKKGGNAVYINTVEKEALDKLYKIKKQ